MDNQLDNALEHYEAAINRLSENGCSVDNEQVLAVLNARDAVQVALKEQKNIPNSRLQKVIQLDERLRENAVLLTKAINGKTAEKLQQWRESVQPSADAWWWRLEAIAPHPWDNLDWLWKLFSLAGWTANISLLATIATRFLSGGVGLAGVAAVTLPTILTLLQASSELTKTGSIGFEKLLDKSKIPKQYHEEAKLGSTLLMSVALVIFWLALPSISKIYHANGLKNYKEGNLGTAEKDYQRAIALDEDNVEAHYNLGNLYEDWL